MTSKFKALTGSTPQSSSARNTGGKVRQYEPSASMTTVEGQTTSTKITPKLSKSTSTTDKKGSTTDKIALASMMLRAAVSILENNGLIERFKLLSEDGTTVDEIRLILDPKKWTESLDLIGATTVTGGVKSQKETDTK